MKANNLTKRKKLVFVWLFFKCNLFVKWKWISSADSFLMSVSATSSSSMDSIHIVRKKSRNAELGVNDFFLNSILMERWSFVEQWVWTGLTWLWTGWRWRGTQWSPHPGFPPRPCPRWPAAWRGSRQTEGNRNSLHQDLSYDEIWAGRPET